MRADRECGQPSPAATRQQPGSPWRTPTWSRYAPVCGLSLRRNWRARSWHLPWLLTLTAFAMITTLALGLLISTMAHSQQEAMLMTYLLIMPSVFLSGYIFPIEAMPAALRFLSNFVPLRYLLVVIRGIILKGVGLELLRQEIAILGLFSVIILGLAAVRFRKKLE